MRTVSLNVSKRSGPVEQSLLRGDADQGAAAAVRLVPDLRWARWWLTAEAEVTADYSLVFDLTPVDALKEHVDTMLCNDNQRQTLGSLSPCRKRCTFSRC